MRKLLLLSCLAVSAFGVADEPAIRVALQAKYDSVDTAMAAGDMHSIANFCDSSKFVALDVQKQSRSLNQLLNQLDQKKGQKLSIKTTVESADTLAGMAKAALRISSTQTVTEKGKAVIYKTTKTEEDTWEQDGDDWKLVQIRLTSNLVTRDGKTIVNESEKVLTDWDRQYGHRPSATSRRHHRG
jgi:hypothetical protein